MIHDFVCRHVRFDAIQTHALHIVLTCNRHTFPSKRISGSTLAVVTCYSNELEGGGAYFLSVSGVDTSLLKPNDS